MSVAEGRGGRCLSMRRTATCPYGLVERNGGLFVTAQHSSTAQFNVYMCHLDDGVRIRRVAGVAEALGACNRYLNKQQ